MAHADAARSSSVNSGTFRVLAWLGVLLQAAALVAVLWMQRWGGAWAIGIFLVLSLAFLLVQDRLPSLVSLLVVLAAILNSAGWAWNLFDQFVWYDEVVHTFAPFAVLSAVGYIAWERRWTEAAPGSGKFVLWVAAVGFGLGVLWEIAEALFLDLRWTDTIVDLVLDTIGAALGGWFAAWVIREQGAGHSA